MEISGIVYLIISVFVTVFSIFIGYFGKLPLSKFSLFFLTAVIFFVIGIIKLFNGKSKNQFSQKKIGNQKSVLKSTVYNKKNIHIQNKMRIHSGPSIHQPISHQNIHNPQNTKTHPNLQIQQNVHPIKQCPRCGQVLHHRQPYCHKCNFRFY